MLGKSLGHYEILDPLGSGGMGDVYRAHDTTLNRDVAIKVLPEDLADDPDRLARLKREAHLLAALNHPNVATIHGFDESDGTRFLVMELVKGESLEQRLAGGRLPVDEALDICRQIAEALEAAHEEGIIHRDLKPANVLITPEGRAKVLDFGLAKTVEAATSDVDMSQSPTLTVAGTQAGVILGTAPYMSPEQVRGKPVDKRTDIWAYGCVLYEALTGSRAFNRETVADTMAAILEVDPPWDALPRDTPTMVRALLLRCLRKDPRRRLHDIADGRIEIEEAISEPEARLPGAAAMGEHGPLRRRALPWAVAVVAVVALVAVVGTWSLIQPAAPADSLSMNLKGGTRLWGGHPNESSSGGDRPSRTAFAFTPDGRAIVYSAKDGADGRLYLRRFDDFQSVPIEGTEGASNPFLSPDGRSVGFVVGEEIRVVPIEGGEPHTVLADAPFVGGYPYGLSWAEDWIVFGGRGGIFRVAAAGSGGVPEQLTVVDRDRGEYRHILPQVLPGGATVLYTIQRDQFDWRVADIVVQPIGQDEPVVLVSDGADARYSETGHLVFARRGVLMAVGFDVRRGELTGEPLLVIPNVMQAINSDRAPTSGAAQFGFSASGSLAYVTGGSYTWTVQPPAWVDPEGNVEPLPVPTPAYNFNYARISPDGTQLAYRTVVEQPSTSNITVLNLDTTAISDLPLPGRQNTPTWSHDGARLGFSSDHEGARGLYWINANLRGEVHPITESGGLISDWSVNDVLAFTRGYDIWVVELEGAAGAREFVAGEVHAHHPVFSPDGRWLVYTSEKTGQRQLSARPYPAGEPLYSITTEGGDSPAWSRDGSELFYRVGSKLMALPISERDGALAWGSPREVFDHPTVYTTAARSYDEAADGRFLVMLPWEAPAGQVTELRIILNFFEELKRRVPGGR